MKKSMKQLAFLAGADTAALLGTLLLAAAKCGPVGILLTIAATSATIGLIFAVRNYRREKHG